MKEQWCECNGHRSRDFRKLTDFYCERFLPTGWQLQYTTLTKPEENRVLYIVGKCNRCGGFMRTGVNITGRYTHDALLRDICHAMLNHRPYAGKDVYDKVSKEVGYYGGCEERSWFYADRDKRSQFRRSREFLDLFNDWDREAARLWLEKNFPPGKPAEVFRDTGGSLFSTVIRMAKASGDFSRAEAILDYHLPCEHEEGIREGVKLTAYEFDFVPILNYGSEGIYIDCYLKGKFDESGRFSLHVGTLKTLKRDLETEKIMGELCGILHYYENRYVNQNLRRYTPDKELEAEYQRQLARETGKGEGGGSHG